jgi:hypothetical protein
MKNWASSWLQFDFKRDSSSHELHHDVGDGRYHRLESTVASSRHEAPSDIIDCSKTYELTAPSLAKRFPRALNVGTRFDQCIQLIQIAELKNRGLLSVCG